MLIIPILALSFNQSAASPLIISKVDSYHLGKHYNPWITRIKQGDPWALAELAIECFRLSRHRPVSYGDLAKLAIPQLQELRGSNSGKAYYLLAEMTWLAHFPIEGKEDKQLEYIEYLEKSSGHGYAFADYKLYDESRVGSGMYRIKSPFKKSKEEVRAVLAAEKEERNNKLKGQRKVDLQTPDSEWRRTQADQFKRRAVERLIPLARQGNMDACLALRALVGSPLPNEIQTNFDQLCTQSQVTAWIEDAARKGSVEAQISLAWSHLNSKGLYEFSENSIEFQDIVEIGERYDPNAIQTLAEYYCEKKDLTKARYWVTKGREALGQSNDDLDRLWDCSEDGD